MKPMMSKEDCLKAIFKLSMPELEKMYDMAFAKFMECDSKKDSEVFLQSMDVINSAMSVKS